MLFKLKEGIGSVREFTINDVNYHPGDTVELPASYDGEKWLIRLDPIPVVAPPPQKITPISEAANVAVKPLGETVQKVADLVTSPAVSWGASKKKTTPPTTARRINYE